MNKNGTILTACYCRYFISVLTRCEDWGALMTKQRKIFILYARFGEGHWQAASALRQSFNEQGNTEVRLIDLLAESHPFINEVSRFVYRKSYRVFPQFYGWVYEATKGMKSDSLFANWLHSFGTDTLKRMVELEQPDAIIHTFPTLVLPSLRSRMRRKIPMFNVITDFDLHHRWVHPAVDKYYVATEDISKQLHALGISVDRIAATGIPIRPTFGTENNKYAMINAQSSGLNPHKPTVLVMAASIGSWADIAELCHRLITQCNSQAIIVCGRNRTLECTLKNHFSQQSDISVFGYVTNMDELMSMSFCIITKPGGLTLSEALTAALPIFLYRPVPGQERNNARYLENKGAAVICSSIDQLLSSIAELINKPKRRTEMQLAISSLSRIGASDRIALDISNELHIMEGASSSLVR